MMLMDSPRHAGYSPVCLDLSVGLPSPSPPPRSDTETEADYARPDSPASGPAMSSVTEEKVTGRCRALALIALLPALHPRSLNRHRALIPP